ncbi:MAG: ABC transporter permease [Saprospiraceae bacterium]
MKVALRNLRKHKFFSFLNILGLALSMSVSLIIITVVRNQYGYDRFHPAPERTYRIITEALRKNGGSEKYASTPYPLGTAIKEDFALAETLTQLSQGPGGDAETEGLVLPLRTYYADPAFFRVFGFHLHVGNEADVLTEPYSIVLAAKTAKRFFGDQNPVGKTIQIGRYGQFSVTGVFRETEEKTHLDFEALVSSSTMASREKLLTPQETERRVSDNWRNYYATYNYLLLRPGKTKAELDAVLAELGDTRYQGMTLETRDAGYRFHAQALAAITPAEEMLSQTIEHSMPIFVIWGLMGFVLLLTIFPCLNYANLSIARALVRAKEVGVRKVMGARRGELIRQFLSEALVTAVLALALAWLLRLPLLRLLEGFLPEGSDALYSPFSEDWKTYLLFIAFTLVVGLAAGWAPALYLSKFRPDAVLRDVSRARVFSRLSLRKALIVTQFAISMIFLIVVTTMWRQLEYITRASYGFDRENIVNINLAGVDYKALSDELARDHRVQRISAASHTIGTWEDWSVDVRRNREDEPMEMRNFFVDRNFIPNLDLTLLEGENFPADLSETRQQFVILNEKALETFRFGSAKDAIGQQLWLDDTTSVAVLGVLKNFHFRPLTYDIGPLLLLYDPQYFTQLNVRLRAGDPTAALAAIEGVWKKFSPNHPLEYAFLDERVADCYAEMRRFAGMLAFFALLAISIACMGLLGIVTFSVEMRAKEISIRKVIGASVTELALLLSRHYLVMLGIAILIAVPVGYFLANLTLQTFAYRISVGAGILLACIGALLALALLTVGWQTVRAALMNPVEKLRKE